MTDADRIDRLERAMDDLRRELADLRAAPAVDHRAADPLPPPAFVAAPAPPARPALPPADWAAGLGLDLEAVPRDRATLETLVGRYGTVALAALLILMGVGAFLTWAATRFTVGPTARVALGAVAAAALAAAGWRLRRAGDAAGDPAGRPGARRFGDVLLALALAVVHVDAWGAGPYLGLVPPPVALGVAAAASAALALLAWRAREQALFVVGVGGALLAPFVTSASPGNPLVLAVYGWLVLAAGLLALPRGDAVRWPVAARLLGVAAAAYVAAMLNDAGAATTVGNAAGRALPRWTLRRDVPALFALADAATALALGVAGATAGAGLALAYLVTTLAALLALALASAQGAPRLAIYAFAATALTYAALRLQARATARHTAAATQAGWMGYARFGPPTDVPLAVLLPLALLGVACMALPRPASPSGAAVAAAWAGLAALVAWTDRRATWPAARRGAHATAGGLAATLAVVLLLDPHPLAESVALAALGAALAWLASRVGERLALVAPLVALAAASAIALLLLGARPAYGYQPFLTRASLAAAAVVAGWGVLAWRAWRDAHDRGSADAPAPRPAAEPLPPFERGALMAAAPLAALLWGREELARTGSPDIATVLVVGWFATAGIAAIAAGRRWRMPAARQAGLALAIYAAFKALVQASRVDAVGLRVGSYLLVGGFLLAVGWWYRAAGDPGDVESAAPAASG